MLGDRIQPRPGGLIGVDQEAVRQVAMLAAGCIGLMVLATVSLVRRLYPVVTMLLYFGAAAAGFIWLLTYCPLFLIYGPWTLLMLYPLAVVAVSAPFVMGWSTFAERPRARNESLERVKRFVEGDNVGSQHQGHAGSHPYQAQPPHSTGGTDHQTATPAMGAGPSSAFDVSMPTRNLSSIAGMSALKADLEPVLAKFRVWHQSRDNPKAPRPEPVDRNGILFTGPPGNGKSTMAEAIAGELRLPLLRVGTQDLSSKWVNETAEKITAVVNEAIAIAPCVLFIDEMDAVAPRRDSNSSHQEDKKGVNTLLQQIDRLRKKCVLLVGATNFLENMDAAVVRDGRFDFRIEIPWPDEEARFGILTALAAKHKVALPTDVAQAAAKRWERRSAAFIENVVKRLRDEMQASPGATATSAMVRAADRAVSKRAGSMPRAGRKLSDLALLPDVKRQAGSIVSRLAHWDEITDQGGTPPRGILLYGPPGTGKTELVSAMARELGEWHMFEVRTAEILADSRSFSKVIELATTHRPAFVFIDEADDLLKDRTASYNATATNEILKAIDGTMGAVPEVVFVAATNNPDAIDAAAKRSGRFSEKLFLDLFRGDELVAFIAHHIERNAAKLQLETGLGADAIAACIQAAGPADIIGVMNSAVNATFDGSAGAGKRRSVTLADIERATAELRAV
ncbi:ATP-binding protein [Inhella sp.]|uniref:AAA family ATPase n=2 Tax=Inhella sp. TaxID=1921806 RepID=UPI00260C072C|nr:ATP-binding protein [Inhella sp.]